jgi:hypothetical protein
MRRAAPPASDPRPASRHAPLPPGSSPPPPTLPRAAPPPAPVPATVATTSPPMNAPPTPVVSTTPPGSRRHAGTRSSHQPSLLLWLCCLGWGRRRGSPAPRSPGSAPRRSGRGFHRRVRRKAAAAPSPEERRCATEGEGGAELGGAHVAIHHGWALALVGVGGSHAEQTEARSTQRRRGRCWSAQERTVVSVAPACSALPRRRAAVRTAVSETNSQAGRGHISAVYRSAPATWLPGAVLLQQGIGFLSYDVLGCIACNTQHVPPPHTIAPRLGNFCAPFFRRRRRQIAAHRWCRLWRTCSCDAAAPPHDARAHTAGASACNTGTSTANTRRTSTVQY